MADDYDGSDEENPFGEDVRRPPKALNEGGKIHNFWEPCWLHKQASVATIFLEYASQHAELW
jgi:hypothetical protein